MVGHWWFEPSEASHCCSPAVNGAFIRTVTTSFGSICFGSLIVAILEALRMLARVARENDDGNGILLCIAECILGCLASIMEYFNKVRRERGTVRRICREAYLRADDFFHSGLSFTSDFTATPTSKPERTSLHSSATAVGRPLLPMISSITRCY